MGAKPPAKVKIIFGKNGASGAGKTPGHDEKPPEPGDGRPGARGTEGSPPGTAVTMQPAARTKWTPAAAAPRPSAPPAPRRGRPASAGWTATRDPATPVSVPHVRPTAELVTRIAWVGRPVSPPASPEGGAPGPDARKDNAPSGHSGHAETDGVSGGDAGAGAPETETGNDLYITELTESIRDGSGGRFGDGDLKISTRPLTAGALCEAVPPRFSPDGMQLAYMSVDGWLRRRHLETGKDTALVQINPYSSFAWSPDGTHMVIDGLTIIDTATGETTILKGDGHSPRWLPRGGHIIFGRSHQLWVAEWPEGDEAPLAGLPLESRTDLQVSPDGRRIAFTTLSGSTGGVGIVDLESASTVTVETGSDRVLHPRWSPDGSRLLVTSTRFLPTSGKLARLGELISVHPDGTVEGALAVSTCLQGGAGAWTASGRRVVFLSCGAAGEVGGGPPGIYTVPARMDGTISPEGSHPRPVAVPAEKAGIAVMAFDTHAPPAGVIG